MKINDYRKMSVMELEDIVESLNEQWLKAVALETKKIIISSLNKINKVIKEKRSIWTLQP